jgi:DNA-binding PadR family transcriptional regulator
MIKKVKKYSPLTETTFYILISLFEPLHGYGIITKVEEMTSGRVKLAAGTLYGALNTLLNNGLIDRTGEDPENPRRIIYQITLLGEFLIDIEIKRLKDMVEDGIQEKSKKREKDK